MKRRFSNVNDDTLIERFRMVAAELGEAVTIWMPAARLADRLFAIKAALRERGTSTRLKLTPSLNDADRFIRYYAAKELFGLLPEQCRRIIEENTREFDAIAGDARGFLRAVDEGTYRPE